MTRKIDDEAVLSLLKQGLGQRETGRRLGMYHRSVHLAAQRLQKEGRLDPSVLDGWKRKQSGKKVEKRKSVELDTAWQNVRYQDARIIER